MLHTPLLPVPGQVGSASPTRPRPDAAIKILIDVSTTNLLNVGDIAMLQVAVSRLRSLWPSAAIQVIVSQPNLLERYCPDAGAILDTGHQLIFRPGGLFGRFGRRAPALERTIRTRYLHQLRPLMAFRCRRRGVAPRSLDEYLTALRDASLVVVTGGSWIADDFADSALLVLDTLHIASSWGKPTAILGQGLGPAQSSDLLQVAAQVLPSVNLIALREARASLPFLRALGVPERNVVLTGDDAIELAYAAQPPPLSTGIGVNLRVATYSHVALEALDRMRPALHLAAAKLSAELVPLPISSADHVTDTEVIRALTSGFSQNSNAGEALDSPRAVIDQARRCRVVLTGSYHAAVFALSQGIPVIGITKSPYYVYKFQGLADQFGDGCTLIPLDAAVARPHLLLDALESAWHSAPHVRPALLAAAKRQIEAGHAAYERLATLVEQA